MEREGHSAAAAIPCRRWAEDVIVLSSGRPAWRPPPSSEGEQYPEAPPEKLYYKTKLCDKYESSGRCTYEDGCTFAHGRAELRPPLPPLSAPPHGGGFGGGVWRRPPGPEHEQQRGGGGYLGGGGGKVCHNFRDKGSCHFGDKCAFPHASPAPPGAAAGGAGEHKTVVDARRSATPPAARNATAPRYAGASAPGRAFPPVLAAAARDRLRKMAPEGEGGGGKASVLELLALRKTNGIYGDWPEQYSS